jgi:uncharacterized protein
MKHLNQWSSPQRYSRWVSTALWALLACGPLPAIDDHASGIIVLAAETPVTTTDDSTAAALLPADQIEQHAVMIPMRDGVRLSAFVYRPRGDGRWPVLLEQRYANGNVASVQQQFTKLAQSGYAVVLANFRGSQQSEGVWRGYRALGWGERQDGYDLVEWLAAQPWSTGKVGTFGSSQAGFAQNFLAVAAPPHLAAQYMIDTGLSLFHEGYRIGGITRPERFRKLADICRVPAHNDELLQEWFQHPSYDSYWADEDCTRHFDRMNVPCFTVGSWFDFMCVGSVDSFIGRQHRGGPNSRGQQQLLIGPWLHSRFKETNVAGEMTFPESAKFAMDAHMIRWFDHHLKGIDNGVMRDPTVRYYVMGPVGEDGAPGHVWRTAADWPIPADNVAWYLHGDRTLTVSPPKDEGGSVGFLADPQHPASIPSLAFPGAQDARPFESQADVRTFDSEVLTQPIEWTGRIDADVWLSSNRPDTDLIVRVSDVYPDGRSMLLVDMVRRVRYREGFDREAFLVPDQPTRVQFSVGWISQIFATGHRIRVTVASTGAPFYEPNPNTGEPFTLDPPLRSVIAHNRVWTSRSWPSRIIAPTVSGSIGNGL